MAKAASKKPLSTYAAKRDFAQTGEPAPKPAKTRSAGLQFVVQKHDARRLHFDLRLELGGVLKSWAVTRGPSLKPGVRRLAVETEDHPMDYLEWEGVIPEGQYGGGTMIVWDRGTWIPEGDAAAAIRKGKLTFDLNGKRLHGRFTLVRMKPEGKRNNWLLIKGHDDAAIAADAPELTEKEMTSALTGVTNSELAQKQALRPDHKARAAAPRSSPQTAALQKLAGAGKGILPVFVEPSLAAGVASPPDGPLWVHEIKHDGYRTQARLDGGKVKLLTRKGLDWTSRFPTVADAIKKLPAAAALIDGEIISQDDKGQSSFSGLQGDLKSGSHARIVYYAFDLLYLNGVDLRGVALVERKRLLAEILASAPGSFALKLSEHLETGGDTVLQNACQLGLEGIVSKRADLPYVSGRGEHWLKSKCTLRQEFVVVGYVPSTASADAVGSLVLGYYDKGVLVHAGRSGTGFSTKEARSLLKLLKPLVAPPPKFRTAPSRLAARDVIWVRPERVAEIEYRGWTADGLLRQSAYKGLREDKPPDEIVLESEAATIPARKPSKAKAPAKKPAARPKPDPGALVALTHPERVLWSEGNITKQDLADFYTAIAPWILPHIENRVLSLVRCPDGAEAKCFFAKHAWMGIDAAVRKIDAGFEKPMLAIDSVKGLLSLVQMSVLEIHVWGSMVADLERPDRMIFDLDPGDGTTWQAVREAALEIRRRLQSIGLQSFVKTTGGKGLHVVVPLVPDADWETVKNFSHAFAEVLSTDQPDLYVSNMAKNRRRGKVFVDYLRNGRGATAVAAYSTRARPGAPVSVPITWEELPKITAGNQFTLKNLPARLAKLDNDPWKEISAIRQKLPK